MARSNQTTAARARGEAILAARGALRTDTRETRVEISSGVIADLLHALGPADAVLALEAALRSYRGTLRDGQPSRVNLTRMALDRGLAAFAHGGA